MAFLGGTFFPIENLPEWAQTALSFLPLTHATRLIRASALNEQVEPVSFAVLVSAGLLFLALAMYTLGKAKD